MEITKVTSLTISLFYDIGCHSYNVLNPRWLITDELAYLTLFKICDCDGLIGSNID